MLLALAGNPNSGKTTLFNALTGLRQKVANYPGVTVEKKLGKTTLIDGSVIDVIDLPGTYSLISRSPDERVSADVLHGLRDDTPAPDVIIAVVDASNLQRNLYLVSQIIELGRPMVVALNMMDIAQRRGLRLSSQLLQIQLGVQVIPIIASKGKGIDELKRAITQAQVPPMPLWNLPVAMREEITRLHATFATNLSTDSTNPRRGYFSDHVYAERLLTQPDEPDVDASTKIEIDRSRSRLSQLGIDPMQADIEAHYSWIDEVVARSIEPACAAEGLGSGDWTQGERNQIPDLNSQTLDPRPQTLAYETRPTLTDQLDRIFLHKIWGLFVFAGIMASLFMAIFYLADPLMGATEAGIGWLGGFVSDFFPQGTLRDLWNDGIVGGVGGVLVFVPQIAVLFLFIAILEDSGYLARAAFLMDRVLGKFGLPGKGFIPLLSSHACAIPGIMATRTIENRSDRFATIFVAPFMSCAARLPVYGLLIGAFFSSYSPVFQGSLLFACYALGILAAVVTAWVFKKTFLKRGRSTFILELPTYKVPQISQIIRAMLTNTWAFIRRAGTIIFALSVVLWALTYYPRLDAEHIQLMNRSGNAEIAQMRLDYAGYVAAGTANTPDPGWCGTSVRTDPEPYILELQSKAEKNVAAAQLKQSYAGVFGHFIEPVIRPLGYDWKMGVGLVGAFAAREVFVSTMGIVYGAGDAEEDAMPLEKAMQNDRYPDGKPVWTIPVALSLLTWFVLAMQCISTIAIVKRETGGWAWPMAQLVYMTVLAYVCSLVVYQVSMRLIG